MRHHHANAAQRAYRSRRVRIDYAPGEAAAAVLDALRAESGHLTNRAVLDAIVTGWAAVYRPEFLDMPMRARMTLAGPDSKPSSLESVVCGAKRHRDGQPCEALSVPGKRRCRFHGGASTGPERPKGRRRWPPICGSGCRSSAGAMPPASRSPGGASS
ncbi:HGGxSTG domain-containing protein [Pseudoxanthomonas sp.]|uniref:HGGxSTG domain-containing protein n=1 Tax=Pseudoxanthomonas sp. TaxID=1871049 RepID=UPI0035B33400